MTVLLTHLSYVNVGLHLDNLAYRIDLAFRI